MKRILYVFSIVLVTLAFTACNSKKEPSELIVGDWMADRIAESYSQNGQYMTENVAVFLKMSLYSNGYFTWTAVGDNDNESGTWALMGNTLTMKFMGYDDRYMTFNVVTLTEKELTLRYYFENGSSDYYFTRVK